MLTALMLSAIVAGSPLHGEDPAQDGVVATAPATSPMLDATSPTVDAVPSAQSVQPHGLTTDEQIARWLAARSAEPAPAAESPIWRDDRKPHGEISVGYGTGGYRDYGAAVSLPLGESGRLDLSVRQVENGYPYGYGYGAGYDPWLSDSGYVFPGRSEPGAAWDYERHLARPEGPPNRWPRTQSQQPARE